MAIRDDRRLSSVCHVLTCRCCRLGRRRKVAARVFFFYISQGFGCPCSNITGLFWRQINATVRRVLGGAVTCIVRKWNGRSQLAVTPHYNISFATSFFASELLWWRNSGLMQNLYLSLSTEYKLPTQNFMPSTTSKILCGNIFWVRSQLKPIQQCQRYPQTRRFGATSGDVTQSYKHRSACSTLRN